MSGTNTAAPVAHMGVVTNLVRVDGVTQLTLPEPPSANRWWRMVVVGGNARMVVSQAAREYKQSLEALRGLAILDGPVRLSIDWYRGRKSGDLDKRIGVVLDALQGVLYTTDAQIVEVRARRFDDPGHARVVVTAAPAITAITAIT